MASFIKGLELDKEDLRGKLFALKEEAGSDDSFCLSCLMWQCLSKQDSGLLLLAAQRPFNHYYHVGMKLGYNLMSQSKRAVVLELGKAFCGGSDDELFADIGTGKDDALKGLFLGLKRRLEELKSQYRHVYFIVDNLSSLLFLGFTSGQLTTLLHYLRTLADDSVTLVISLQTTQDDEEETRLSAYLCQIADFRLTVAPLRTGSSQDVSGSIELIKKDVSKIESWTNPMLYHYKLSERNVKIFLPGNI
ncbi:hypothetical protein GE061_002356 [Apolygus lucorum]|uniref:Elongator complex protein 6 n=1 Tax=Apolygus lucorum TaxID=248454 RepID=A0A6A4JFT8_APOLU|nr:hypothetical protein GE061_002356 [Apolygus lucorum]